jgi:hypothetical protein
MVMRKGATKLGRTHNHDYGSGSGKQNTYLLLRQFLRLRLLLCLRQLFRLRLQSVHKQSKVTNKVSEVH